MVDLSFIFSGFAFFHRFLFDVCCQASRRLSGLSNLRRNAGTCRSVLTSIPDLLEALGRQMKRQIKKYEPRLAFQASLFFQDEDEILKDYVCVYVLAVYFL